MWLMTRLILVRNGNKLRKSGPVVGWRGSAGHRAGGGVLWAVLWRSCLLPGIMFTERGLVVAMRVGVGAYRSQVYYIRAQRTFGKIDSHSDPTDPPTVPAAS